MVEEQQLTVEFAKL